MRQREAIFCKFVVQQTAIQRGAERGANINNNNKFKYMTKKILAQQQYHKYRLYLVDFLQQEKYQDPL